MVLVLLAVLFALAGVFAIYFGRGTPGWLMLGVVLLVVAVLLLFVGLSNDSDVLNEGMGLGFSIPFLAIELNLVDAITAIGVAAGAISAALIAAVAAIKTLRKTESVKRQLDDVHVLVDGNLTKVLARVDQLTEALEKSDTEVPDEPSVEKKVQE